MGEEAEEHLVAPEGRVEHRVEFPIRVTLSHRELDVAGMFSLAEALDLHEVHYHAEASERPIAVDVLETSRERTVMLVTPLVKLAYEELAAHVDAILGGAKKVLGGSATVERVVFDIARPGIGSDERATLDRIV